MKVPKQEEIKILGDGWIVYCAFCKTHKDRPSDCKYCFTTVSLEAKPLWQLEKR